MNPQQTTRRQFLTTAGAVSAAAAIGLPATASATQPARVSGQQQTISLAGLRLDSAAQETTIRTMPFLMPLPDSIGRPGERGQTRRTINAVEEIIPVDATASVVYLAGMLNSQVGSNTGWAAHPEDDPFRADQQYVGRAIGHLSVVYADGTSDRVPLVFGASAWSPWFGQLYEPFKSIPSARETLNRSLLLHRTGAEFPTFYLALRVRELPIVKIVVRDEDALDGRPMVTGVTLATTDQGEHLQPFDASGVAAVDREPTVDAENPGDWTTALSALAGVLLTRKSDLPTQVEPVRFPDGVDATRIEFLGGGRDGGMLSNIWVANLLDMRAKFAPDDGFYRESGQHAPWYFWGTYGTWFEDYGLYHAFAYARSAEHFAGLAMRNLHDDARYTAFVDFADHWLYYFRADHDPENGPPNPNLNGYPADAPPHWSYVLNNPGAPHDYNDIPGNEELDGHGSTMVARWEAWRWLGKPAGAWLTEPRDGVFGTSRWDSTRDAAEFIVWLMDRYGRDLVYSEGETTGGSSAEGHFQVYPNYTCLVGLWTAVEMAEALGEASQATRWRSYADRIEAAMPAELTVDSAEGTVWKDSPTTVYPSQAHTLAPAWFAQHYEGLDPSGWNTERASITRNTFQREVHRFNGLLRPYGMGYGQGWLTQTAMLLDDMDAAGVSLVNIAHYSYDKNNALTDEWKQWQWIVPEGSIVLPDGSWHRYSDLGNGANQGEAVRALEVASGIDDTDPAELVIMPRIPEPMDGVDVGNARVMVASGEGAGDGSGTVAARVSYRFDKSGVFQFDSDRAVPSLAVRLGPFAAESEARRAVRGGLPAGARTEVVRSGTVVGDDAHWVWVRGLNDVSELELTFMDTIPRGSAALDVGQRVVAAGDVVSMAVVLRNNGATALRAATVKLDVPAGWHAEPRDAVKAATVEPGEEFTARFEVAVPAEQDPSNAAAVTATVRYARQGATPIVNPLVDRIVVRSAVTLVSLDVEPEVVQPGQTTTLRALVRNVGAGDVDGFLQVEGPAGWTSTARVPYRAAAGAETEVAAQVVNEGTQGRSVTLTAQLTQGDVVRDEASVDVFTGRLRCLLGSSTREDWHHDDGYGCVLDEGFRFEDIPPRHWPADAPVRSCWAGNLRLRFHLDVPDGAAGTLRLFIADPDNLGRRESITVEGRDLGTFENFQAGRWVEAPISAADTADGRIDVVITNARQGANAVVSIVEF